MIVGSIKTKFEYLNTKLEVDTWNVTYDTESNIKEDFNGKTAIEDVQEILYLGVVISNDGEKKTPKISYKNKIEHMALKNRLCKWLMKQENILLNVVLYTSTHCSGEAFYMLPKQCLMQQKKITEK